MRVAVKVLSTCFYFKISLQHVVNGKKYIFNMDNINVHMIAYISIAGLFSVNVEEVVLAKTKE